VLLLVPINALISGMVELGIHMHKPLRIFPLLHGAQTRYATRGRKRVRAPRTPWRGTRNERATRTRNQRRRSARKLKSEVKRYYYGLLNQERVERGIAKLKFE
jgi:hypothetical protein